MLRQFHYIDQNGKDQGVNVRNRASELVKLLSDVDMIRAERKKARANRHKFGGIEGGLGSFSGSGSRMQGFGSDNLSFGGYSGGVFGDGGGFGGDSSDFHDSATRGNRFEEYDEYDAEPVSPEVLRRGTTAPPAAVKREAKKPEPKKEPEPDLVDFGEEETVTTTPTAAGKQPAAGGLNMLEPKSVDEDEFDDFQSATPATQPAAPPSMSQFAIPPPTSFTVTTSSTIVAPQPVSGTQGANLNGIVGFTSLTPTPNSSTISSPISTPIFSQAASIQQPQQKPQPPKPTGFQAATPNYFTSISVNTSQPTTAARPSISSTSSFASTTTPTSSAKPSASKPAGGDAFGSLWSAASASAGIQKPASNAASKGPNLASMAKEKASAGIWGTPSPSLSSTPAPSQARTASVPQQQQGTSGGSALDDLLG